MLLPSSAIRRRITDTMIQIKTAYQIKKIAQASDILSQVLQMLLAQAEEGVTPIELDMLARKEIQALGARPSFLGYRGFPAAICVSVDDVVIHGIPSALPLRAGQVVGIDCGVRYGAYYSDAARTVVVGQTDSARVRFVAATEHALHAGIAALSYGNRISDYSRAVHGVARQHNLGIIKEYCGHGVGLAIHEEPSIPNYVSAGAQQRLAPGMVLAVEPMFTLGSPQVYVADDDWSVTMRDGSIAAHCEHTVLITEGAPQALTRWE